jgi:DNA-binding beta-propeller fold protein YncE
MFYFQVGNLTYLGLDPALANNVLSIGSMVSLLILVMALGRRLFGSPAAGRIGAALFFFHGALSFIPFVGSGAGRPDDPSLFAAIARLPDLRQFVSSGFPYRGEEWGVWTQIVFLNQRHLASAIGILLVIALFLLDRLGQDARPEPGVDRPSLAGRLGLAVRRARSRFLATLGRPRTVVVETLRNPAVGGYGLCGVLAGLLPLWNGAIFVAAAAVLAAWLVLLGNRLAMIVLAVVSAAVSIPQLVAIQPGTMAGDQTYPDIYWGFIVGDPTLVNVATYLAFLFGLKLVLARIALIGGTWRQWAVFLAFFSLVGVAFLIQLSVEVLANHKFINAWLVVANVYAGYGLLRLWNARSMIRVPARLVAAGLACVIVAGGVIDLMPVKNQAVLQVGLEGDPLFEWVRDQTDKKDVFLTDIYPVHRILLAGRKLYLGWPYYAWSAGYAVGARETEYREMFGTRSARDLLRRLQANKIDYVVFDDGLRGQGFAHRLNQEVFEAHFEAAFVDATNQYGDLTIYRVPDDAGAADELPDAPPMDMYSGGRGSEAGQFDGPLGIAYERTATVLVADVGNDRIQRFSSDGNPIGTIGAPGAGPGQLDRPTGVAVDSRGNVFVADAGNRRLQEFDRDGAFVREWSAPDGGFVDLADVATDEDRIFVLDAGAGRVVRLDAEGGITSWGSPGRGDGQLREPTGLAVANGEVVVADSGNARVVVFTADGEFVRSWPVAEWLGGTDRAADVTAEGDRLWLSSPATDSILVRRVDGSNVGALQPREVERLEGPAGLALAPGGALFVVNQRAERISLLTNRNP